MIAATAMAQDFNSELTVILNSVSEAMMALEPGHPARPALSDAERSVRRCARKTSGMLALGLRNGARPSSAPLEAVMDL